MMQERCIGYDMIEKKNGGGNESNDQDNEDGYNHKDNENQI